VKWLSDKNKFDDDDSIELLKYVCVFDATSLEGIFGSEKVMQSLFAAMRVLYFVPALFTTSHHHLMVFESRGKSLFVSGKMIYGRRDSGLHHIRHSTAASERYCNLYGMCPFESFIDEPFSVGVSSIAKHNFFLSSKISMICISQFLLAGKQSASINTKCSYWHS